MLPPGVSHSEYADGTDRQTDGRTDEQTDARPLQLTLCFLIDAVSVMNKCKEMST